ncbi:MAG: transposase [Candidatus Gottesmanbacteria bacterium]
MRKTKFANDYYYHVYNRGTDKRNIFLLDSNYVRFIHGLYEFNNANPVSSLTRNIVRGSTSYIARDTLVRKPRDLLVEIIAFCLMPNHFHLILKQLKEGGIAKFMQKMGTGYAMYFNQKNKRNGVLFQGKFKAILIDDDEYFLPLINYIHLNPVELIEPDWKEEGIKNRKNTNQFLEKYRWSSYPDYVGIKNFPSVISKEFIQNYFKTEESLKYFTNQRLNTELESIKDLILE